MCLYPRRILSIHNDAQQRFGDIVINLNKMGGLFSSPAPASNDIEKLASAFETVYQSNGFAKVIDVFVGENGLAQILVLYGGDASLQSWGATTQGASWASGPKFSTNDNSVLTNWSSSVKYRQQGGGVDSNKSDALEKALAKRGIPMDLKMGHKFVCGLVEKGRILTGSSKESYEEC